MFAILFAKEILMIKDGMKTMKPSVKIGSLLLAVVMILSAVFVSGCSLNKEWSYKTSDKELSIGVYIYALDVAYSQAETYAKKLDDYDSTKDSWLDMEITDDDGNTKVAKDWIKEQAETMCLSFLVVDQQLDKEGASVDEATMQSADDQAETYWNVGQYAQYGYVMPMKDDLEPFGISLESFKYCTTEYSTKQSALFNALYGKGGSKEVSDNELTKYFTENYVDYKYLPVNLYTSSADESGKSVNTALSDDDAKKITDELDGYADAINKSDMKFEGAVEKYMDKNSIDTDPSKSSIEALEKFSAGDELKEAVEKLDGGKATTIKVGSGDSAIYYLIYKNDIKDTAVTYFDDASQKSSVLSAMKQDEFNDYIKDLTKDLDYDANTGVIDSYNPKMFFKAVEPTTSASTTTADE